MSFWDARIRVYKRVMRPLQPRLYSFICTFMNVASSDDERSWMWNGEEIVVDPPIDDERERGRAEAGTKWLTFFILSIPFFWSAGATLLADPTTSAFYISAISALVFGLLALASTHGLETPTISSYEERDPS